MIILKALATISATSTSILSLFVLRVGGHNCVNPRGLDDAQHIYNINTTSLNFPPDPNGGVFGALIDALIPAVSKVETPIQFRNIQWIMAGLWGTTASHHPTALDLFGRGATARRCDNVSSDFAYAHRRTSFSYVFLFATKIFSPRAYKNVMDLLIDFGLDPLICEKDDCSDVRTPWGLAFTIVHETEFLSKNDGWNAIGTYDQTFNPVPFQDWRSNRYEPSLKKKNSWKPLLESNGLGFLYRQEHVTPHIGQTGKSFLLGDDKICALSAPRPDYNYKNEIKLALERSATLNDKKKMEIEMFDSKITSILPLTAQYFLRSNHSLDSFQYILAESIIISVLYESILVAWKEKVKFDLIRPTTKVHDELGYDEVTAWGGPYRGTTILRANEWQPYIRTMPHSEYPSASACVCTAWREAISSLTDSDDFKGGMKLTTTIVAGSSFTEPGEVPKEEMTLSYESWSDIAEVCGQSRLNGGMHFTEAVKAGANLCTSIGRDVFASFEKIVKGEAPDQVMDLTAAPREDRCLEKNRNRVRRRFSERL